MCEIDRQVVEVSKHYFPNSLASAYNDPRLTLMFNDAAAYLINEGPGMNYDCIIIDSSDPVGPAETLFRKEFFESVAAALAPGGVMCNQGECQWLHLEIIAGLMTTCRGIFNSVRYAYTTLPTYPSGQIGFLLCTMNTAEGEAVDPAGNSCPCIHPRPLLTDAS
jgi:spermidine synthase